MKQPAKKRNQLLNAGQNACDPYLLSSYEACLARTAVVIASLRLQAIDLWQAQLERNEYEIYSSASLGIEGQLEAQLRSLSLPQAEEQFLDDLVKNRPLDMLAKRTLLGPHNSDFIVVHKNKAKYAGYASTGEQKSLLISMVLAQAHIIAEKISSVPHFAVG